MSAQSATAFKPYAFKARTYPNVIPSLANGVETTRHVVTIVGGGLVGLAAALGLARYGIKSVVIEADSSVCSGSRAICLSRRSLEIFQRLGVLDKFLDKGLPWTGGRTYYRNTEVLHFSMPHDSNQKLPPMLNIEQFYIEQFLVDGAQNFNGLIDVRWDSRVTALRSNPDGVQVDVQTSGYAYSLHADWLIACDGARSFVRDSLGVQLNGTSYEARYVIADIELETELPTERLAWFDPPSNPDSSVLMHRQPDKVWRIDYQLAAGEDAEQAVMPENVLPRIQRHLDMIGQRGAWSPIWISLYKARALTLDKYTHGRVIFAGDAAHLIPIFGVRGANSGIDDTDNLAWKLAMRIKGLASDQLLDSYSVERVQAARENLRQSMKSTEFMSPPSFGFQLMQKAVLTLAASHPELRSLINPRQTSAIDYGGSSLNCSDDSQKFSAGPPAGTALPESPVVIVNRVDRAGYLSETLTRGFTAYCFTDDGVIPKDFRALESRFASLDVPFVALAISLQRPSSENFAIWDSTGKVFALFGARPGTLYLVRPDGYVLGRWMRTDARVIGSEIFRVLDWAGRCDESGRS
jgi:3-(3-hydroxy-phenyl)propionate hydroxylase